MQIIHYTVYELWQDNDLAMSLRIEQRPESGDGFCLIDHADDVSISVHRTFAEARDAAIARLIVREQVGR